MNFGDKYIAESLVTLPNYQFVAFTMTDGLPILSDPIIRSESPIIAGDEVPARKAQAWATANTGKPKKEIQFDIERILRF